VLAGEKGVEMISGAAIRNDAAATIALRAATGLSLFSNEGGTKINSVSGNVHIQAQQDGIQILAKQVLDIISSSDWVNIRAKQGIRIKAGGSEIVLDRQGISGFTGGNFDMHASAHQFLGAQGITSDVNHEFPELAKLLLEKSWIEIRLLDSGEPLRGEKYILTDPDGAKHHGVLDDDGFVRIEPVARGHCTVEFPEIGEVKGMST
jgi:uncharacterized protein (DUF2345 family)